MVNGKHFRCLSLPIHSKSQTTQDPPENKMTNNNNDNNDDDDDDRKKRHPFPFDCIVVTSPDEASATSANVPLTKILTDRLQEDYPNQSIRVISTYDSYGARCGSGGGTLAALECAKMTKTRKMTTNADDDDDELNLLLESILILHAGGDSSRCPTQMILGKAWTSLPCQEYPNPTTWLISQIQLLFEDANFPKGTVVVAATDTLLTFFNVSTSTTTTTTTTTTALNDDEDKKSTIDWASQEVDGNSMVLGIAVPAVIETATNHGVYVLSNTMATTEQLTITDPLEVWQKPSVETLRTTQISGASASFERDGGTSSGQKYAWIDTGVIVFLPRAVSVLDELSKGILTMCTRTGIQAAYEKDVGDKTRRRTIEDFAKENARKVDLYTEIMHNLSWPSRTVSDDDEGNPLRTILSKVILKIMVAPHGRFLHLGTTQELVEFVTKGAYYSPRINNSNNNNDDSNNDVSMTIRTLSSNLSLQPRHQSWIEVLPLDHNVTIQSTFPNNTSIGRGSLIEYCDLDGYNSVVIGRNCMVSGWRNPCHDTTHFDIPNNITVQMLTLKKKKEEDIDEDKYYVYMVLGTCDAVKAEPLTSTIFGLSVSDFLERTGLIKSDIGWTENLGPSHQNLWNTKLHIKVPATVSFQSAYGWLKKLLDGGSVTDDPSFKTWLTFPRFSLKELHGIVDSEIEWTFRQEQEVRVRRLMQTGVIPHLRQLLLDRRNDSTCDLQWIVELSDTTEGKELLVQILTALEDSTLIELSKNEYDICGRTFMIASALLADFADRLDSPKDDDMVPSDEIVTFCSSLILQIRSLSFQHSGADEAIRYLTKITEYRRKYFVETSTPILRAFSEVMERLSFCMNELSIGWGYRKFLDFSDGNPGLTRTESPTTNQWVESSAPARVDFAGGWSDTPPICYEFGGKVTGMAVRVDAQKPLSCKCRIVNGERGILLRSENRNSRDGTLLHAVEVEINDLSGLADFRNPMSDCALLKAALICLCLITEDELHSDIPLQDKVNRFCSSTAEDVRLEIVSTSILPQGSGMGTSSILAAAVLACISKCVGYGTLEDEYLLHGVLMLEQLLTSGGGWQDQAHGIIPGIKMVSSAPSQLPVALTIERIPLSDSLKRKLDSRMVLVFTGMTRLARNILQDVLRRWSRRTFEVVETVSRNIELAEQCRDAIVAGEIDKMGEILSEYSSIKVYGMAGEDSGALPDCCRIFMESLLERKMIQGASLCGAGGGGFMVLVLSPDATKETLAAFVSKELVPVHPDLADFTFHSCQICNEGLTTTILKKRPVSSLSTINP